MSIEEKNLIIYMSLFGGTLVIIMIILFLTFYKVKKKMMVESFEVQQKHQKEINNIVVEIQNQTLKNIGRELHDNLGQKLTLANLQIGMMKVDGKMEGLNFLSETLQESIKDLRSLSKTLNSDVVENNGLVYCIKHETFRLERLNYIDVEMHTLGVPYRLSKEKELVLFRIFQEAINNTIKHAQASSLQVHLEFGKEQFKMRLEDNGIGFNIETNPTSIGLKNMQSRAEFIQAKLRIKSDNLNGTNLEVILAIKKNIYRYEN